MTARATFVNRHTGHRYSALMTSHVATRRSFNCTCCAAEIPRGEGRRYWITSNMDGILCATCLILNLDAAAAA